MTVGVRRNVDINLSLLCLTISENEHREALYIGTELYPLLTAPAQIKCTFSLVAINMQQFCTFAIRFYRIKRRYKSKQWRTSEEWDRARKYSESKCSKNTPSLQVLFLGIILSAGSWVTWPRRSGLARKEKNNFQNVANPLNEAAFVFAGHRRAPLNPTWLGSASVGSVAHDLTLITIGLEKVIIYTT